SSGPLKNTLSMEPPDFKSARIYTTGTVFNANNPVTCTLTPIDGTNGTTLQVAVGSSGTPTPAPSQTAVAVFDLSDNTAWSVSFAPLPPATAFTGSYLLEATAANEGTVSAAGSVP